jgi:hypothetical protein
VAPGPTHTIGPPTRLPHTTAPATGTTGPAPTPNDPLAGTTDLAAQPTTHPAAVTSDPAAGAADPVTQPRTDSPPGTTEPTVEPTEPAAPNETSVDAVSPRAAGPAFAPATPTPRAFAAPGGSKCGPLECLGAVGALKALDPALADLSVLRGTTLIGRTRGPAAALAAVSESRRAPEAPESPAQSALSGGGGASPFGGGFSLSLFALLLIALAGLAPRLSERLISTSTPWRSVALVLLLERPG